MELEFFLSRAYLLNTWVMMLSSVEQQPVHITVSGGGGYGGRVRVIVVMVGVIE